VRPASRRPPARERQRAGTVMSMEDRPTIASFRTLKVRASHS
jgi:hypothetical protein